MFAICLEKSPTRMWYIGGTHCMRVIERNVCSGLCDRRLPCTPVLYTAVVLVRCVYNVHCTYDMLMVVGHAGRLQRPPLIRSLRWYTVDGSRSVVVYRVVVCCVVYRVVDHPARRRRFGGRVCSHKKQHLKAFKNEYSTYST